MNDVPPRNPVFNAPWEAQAFAMAVALHERGVFTWKEWAAMLAQVIAEVRGRGEPDTGEDYYLHWLAALERLVAAKGVADPQTMARTRDAWQRACARTPHGSPIDLQPEDFGE